MVIKHTGIIGLGAMGYPMARHMVNKGFAVAGYDIAPVAQQRALDAGVNVVDSPAEVGAKAQVVIVMVATDAQVEDVVLRSGLLDTLSKGAVICVASSTSPETARELESACKHTG